METSLHICGFHFYIKWENDNEGYDQRGVKWIDKKNPQCTNSKVVDNCLDGYNAIMNLKSI